MPRFVLRNIPYTYDRGAMERAIAGRLRSESKRFSDFKVKIDEMPPADRKFGKASFNKGFCVLSIDEDDVIMVVAAFENWELEGKKLELEVKRNEGAKRDRKKAGARGQGTGGTKTPPAGATDLNTIIGESETVKTNEPLKSVSTLEQAPKPALIPTPSKRQEPLSIQAFYNLCLLAEQGAQNGGPAITDNARVARGFINRGNTCFRNASIQCLLAAPPIAKVLVGVVQSLDHPNLVPHQFRYWAEMLRVAYNVHLSKIIDREVRSNSQTGAVKFGPAADLDYLLAGITHSFRRRVQLGLGDEDGDGDGDSVRDRQEDAMEFVTFLLDVLHSEEERATQQISARETGTGGTIFDVADTLTGTSDDIDDGSGDWETVEKANVKSIVDELSKSRSKDVKTVTSRLFHVRLRQDLRYVGKKRVSSTFIAERFINVTVSQLPRHTCTIQDALDAYFAEVTIAPSSRGDVEKRKKVSLETLPRVLIIHINRFAYDKHSDSLHKLHRSLEYTHNLSVFARYCTTTLVDVLSAPARARGDSAGDAGGAEGELARYKLHGLVLHHGENPHSGHYTAVTRLGTDGDGDGDGGCWLHLDDQKVRAFGSEHATGFQDQVYILLYSLEGGRGG